MIRLAISVEGETEEEFVKGALGEHLRGKGVHPTGILLGRARRRARRGGNVTMAGLADDMRRLRHSFDAVTSLVDFCGFRDKGAKSADDLVQAILGRIGDVDPRFVFPYVQVHEFEGLLFASPDAFGRILPDAPVPELRSIRLAFKTPEDINDRSETAPSKRIAKLMPRYRKRLDGPKVASEIGIGTIRNECPRFGAWLSRLEALSETAS